MAERDRGRDVRAWVAVTRALVQFGLPVAGLVVLGRAAILTIGGDIAPGRFVLGLVLLLSGSAARLLPRR